MQVSPCILIHYSALCHTFVLQFVFCLPTAAHAPIRTMDLSAHVEKLFANDKYGFSEEYKVIINNMFSTSVCYYFIHILIVLSNNINIDDNYVGDTRNIT